MILIQMTSGYLGLICTLFVLLKLIEVHLYLHIYIITVVRI